MSASQRMNAGETIDSVKLYNDLCYDLSSLQDLACRGAWRSILDKVAQARSRSLLSKPHEHLVYLSYNAIALTKLRRFSEAVAELDLVEKGLDNIYRYETYPHHYPNCHGSMAPFVLRWLHAELPARLGKRQETLDRFYMLLEFIKEKLSKNLADEARQVWRKRECLVINSIISHHLSYKEFGVCLELMKDLVNRELSPVARAVLMSKLGYVQMQFGDLEGAKGTFGVIEGIVREMKGEIEIEMANLVNRNKALVFMVEKDYASAVREYQTCIDRDGEDVVAINNKALCLMYMRDLSDSIKVMENALERIPTIALNETFVVNLCSMYELAYVNHSDIKKTLGTWIARVAPDDFDTSCTRI
ncbi:putative tetratricopeptide-like helical domain superfamily [Helianthus annuus]|uniref:Tetratricopeptide-like helical domain superfamily n=1 Tax=Helianthus annuus TaxID=4232 RepID=A0A9K3DZK5_HELAN|nr:trafficking protein particle complex subunit 12 [Helianthus annuus]XP_022011193.1 trafficking protein particle complex subunit 12 [Helianthus annuus]XP_022011194.1 trafficking protein particle complex subunit 12 [Helianthus annuus]XP_022011195.1 trafficking protein particle complex subunit 12 [Helianthus annuus]KAF5763534.1 putative tetratricopeptide-like helical domain superfamily [Helianthus annuus]KAJ0472176.1 putative tetratricopeptide-like helical domain superfamily [Helianthus annuus]